MKLTSFFARTFALCRHSFGTAGPVVGTFIFLPQLALNLFMDPADPGGNLKIGLSYFVVTMILIFGQAALMSVLLGGTDDEGVMTVGRSMARAVRKLPRIVTFLFLFSLLGTLALIILSSISNMFLTDQEGGVALTSLIVGVGGLYLSARLMIIMPCLVARNATLHSTIRTSWDATSGRAGLFLSFIVSFNLSCIFLISFPLFLGAEAASPLLMHLDALFAALIASFMTFMNSAASVVAYRDTPEDQLTD